MVSISNVIRPKKASGGDDRILITRLRDESTLILLADGATGVGFGYLAAEAFLEICGTKVTQYPHDANYLRDALLEVDSVIKLRNIDADTTGILCLVKNDRCLSTAVGDSEAWLLSKDRQVLLTESQFVKPRIGSGCKCPAVVQSQVKQGDYLVLFSDGLLNDCERNTVFDLAMQGLSATDILKKATKAHKPADDISLIVAQMT